MIFTSLRLQTFGGRIGSTVEGYFQHTGQQVYVHPWYRRPRQSGPARAVFGVIFGLISVLLIFETAHEPPAGTGNFGGVEG